MILERMVRSLPRTKGMFQKSLKLNGIFHFRRWVDNFKKGSYVTGVDIENNIFFGTIPTKKKWSIWCFFLEPTLNHNCVWIFC